MPVCLLECETATSLIPGPTLFSSTCIRSGPPVPVCSCPPLPRRALGSGSLSRTFGAWLPWMCSSAHVAVEVTLCFRTRCEHSSHYHFTESICKCLWKYSVSAHKDWGGGVLVAVQGPGRPPLEFHSVALHRTLGPSVWSNQGQRVRNAAVLILMLLFSNFFGHPQFHFGVKAVV